MMKRFLIAAIAAFSSLTALAATTTPISLLSPTGSTSGQVIKSNGPSSAPTWATPSVGTVTGVLPIANGGTNASTAATALSNLGGAALTGATFTGAITPSQTAGIVGTTTNNNANAGSVGEYQSQTSSPAGATSGAAGNVASLTLSAGDWDVTGTILFAGAASTTTSEVVAGLSTTSATFGTVGSYTMLFPVGAAGQSNAIATPVMRFSLSAPTTVYLVGLSVFATSTLNYSGLLRARRVR